MAVLVSQVSVPSLSAMSAMMHVFCRFEMNICIYLTLRVVALQRERERERITIECRVKSRSISPSEHLI